MSARNEPSRATEPSKPRARPAWSLATRLTVWYTASAIALVALASGFLYWALVTNLEREDDEELADKIRILRELVQGPLADFQAVKRQVELGWTSRQYAAIYARVCDAQGRTLVETPGMSGLLSPDVFPVPAPGRSPERHGIDIRTASGNGFRLQSGLCEDARPLAPDAKNAGAPPRVIQVALDRTPEMDLIDRYRLTLWIVLATASVVSGLIGYYIAQRGVRPLQQITATAARIQANRLGERLRAERLPAELAELAGTFNDMLERLQESFDRLARFSADIAHELRTPVNNLRGEVEVTLAKPRSEEDYREVLGSCLEESVRLSRLIENLLFLARAEHPETQIEKEEVNVTHELRALEEFYEPKAAEAGLKLTVRATDFVIAKLNRPLLQRALGNLIDNALRYTPAGGAVMLGAACDGDWVHLEVADTGPGIDSRHLPHLFDRFYRVDSARAATSGGVGLGLAIVKSIAELHGGSVSVDSEVGRGTRVVMRLPAGT
jgi:two-component system heavy metal sensor histidine kinase CusS